MNINISILIDFRIVKESNTAAKCQILEKLSHDRGRS